MPTTLGPKFSIDWRGRPTGMLRVDMPIWYRFLDEHGNKFIALYYNCLLGGPDLTREEEKDPLKQMWLRSTSKRADVIAETKDEIWIIEVTSESKVRAFGQLMLYTMLWGLDPKSTKPVKAVLVCDEIDTDVIAGAETYGVATYLV